jgi:hypothetical protein
VLVLFCCGVEIRSRSSLILKKCGVPSLIVWTNTTRAKERHVNYSTHLLLALATTTTVRSDAATRPSDPATLDTVFATALQRLRELVESFHANPVSPAAAQAFELQLQNALREMGRTVTQWTYNHLEPAVESLPSHVCFQHEICTRRRRKTPQNVWTLFGQVRLWRACYRPTERTGEPSQFPLALALGLVRGASPALAEQACRWLAEAGATQSRTLARLRRECGVGWGVKKLREVSAAVSAAMALQRHDVQVDQLLAWLHQAEVSKGRHKPLVSVGRDGITLGLRYKGACLFEVASTATVSVLDRRGRRVGTVYLAHTPESGQTTLSADLTRLLEAVLTRWEGSLPRLCYVTDAGDNETGYHETVLNRMVHPRTAERLTWIRVLDFYHASERVWTMAEVLFGKGRAAASWARKRLKWLKEPGGINRVLHSAAAFRDRVNLLGKPLVEFGKAYRYLRERMKCMRYAEYRRVGIPLGSGVTEAACKTVYTQRLKLSGMRWKKAGAQAILNLRVLELSGVWDAAYAHVLGETKEPQVWGPKVLNAPKLRIAA